MNEKQKTIKKPISIEGNGLHTGIHVKLTFKPAPENFGYKFQRIDLEDKPVIQAVAEYVVGTSRGTTIEKDGVKIATIEHVLSAIYGLGIDNILIEINGPEVPIMNGSSIRFVEALKEAEIVDQKAEKNYFEIKEEIRYCNDERNSEIVIFPDDHLNINVLVDYDSYFLGNQYSLLENIDDYEEEISHCRTFVFFNELEPLLNNNLIKGGDLDNAIVILDKEVEQEKIDRIAKLFNKKSVKPHPNGILNNIDLRFSNEPARHKLLDLIGDLSLIGRPIKGKIVATRPGHSVNTKFSQQIRRFIRIAEKRGIAPDYDPNEKPLLDINQIKKILPHRQPFLLVDKILRADENSIIGLKNITMNEPFFAGHFPDEPIMPGVLQIEAMAQVGGILILNSVPDPENYSTYFLKIDDVKFKHKIVPGDTILFKLVFVEPVRRGLAHMRGQAFVGKTLVMEADLLAQIAKIKTDK